MRRRGALLLEEPRDLGLGRASRPTSTRVPTSRRTIFHRKCDTSMRYQTISGPSSTTVLRSDDHDRGLLTLGGVVFTEEKSRRPSKRGAARAIAHGGPAGRGPTTRTACRTRCGAARFGRGTSG